MSSILGQSAPQVFACPNCGEMINTSMAQCAYCNAPVDPQWAAFAANAQATIAGAFNYANNIMNVARALIVLFAVSLIPFLGLAGYAFLALLLAFPVMVLLWLSKYQWGLQGIDKNHEDLKQARRRIIKASVIWVVMLFLRLALEIAALFILS
jgi:RNA polymerase subunit RPABC4/transcription elongation factor Spt4